MCVVDSKEVCVWKISRRYMFGSKGVVCGNSHEHYV